MKTDAAESSALPFPSPAIRDAVEGLATAGNAGELGTVFTRPEVVDFILDLVGYTPDQPLHEKRLLEPSFGNGDFLLAAVARLLKACRKSARSNGERIAQLKDAIRGIELHRETFRVTREKLDHLLSEAGLEPAERGELLRTWLHQGDFLLTPFEGTFTHVVGNPPYVRQEQIPDVLLAEYRRRYATLFDRADLYVPFVENSLRLLAPDGSLGFICSDRWMKNRYGAPLRRLVAEKFHLRVVVDMAGTRAFHTRVLAYPAIMVIGRTAPGITRVARRPDISNAALGSLATDLNARQVKARSTIHEVSIPGRGDCPWLLEDAGRMALIHRLEATFPTLEQAGCRVGIGVATGADRILIGRHDELDIEPERKLPLVMTGDIVDGAVRWRGYSAINPFDADGHLIALEAWPRLARYLETHRTALSKRYVARIKVPGAWFRTIDAIHPGLASRPKLLIPDIKGAAHIVYEDGRLYPHHNLYYIVSDAWDLRALQAVLMAGITRLFVSAYSTRMKQDYLRFQAQYLRRIRIPAWHAIPDTLKAELMAAAGQDQAACRRIIANLYGLTEEEQQMVFGNATVASKVH